MNAPQTWPPVGWKLMALAFWVAAAVVFVVVFNVWPETARSTWFRASSFVVIVAFSLMIMRRPK